jgi:siroheme synthase
VLITAHRASERRSFALRASEKDAPEKDAADWSKLVTSGATLVIYMPGQDYSDIAKRLMAAGLAAGTPCAIISRATTRRQRTHRTTLLDLHRSQLAAPTLLVVGEVVGLADPVAMVDEFVVPGLPPGDDRLPVAIFQDIPLAGATPGSR